MNTRLLTLAALGAVNVLVGVIVLINTKRVDAAVAEINEIFTTPV